MSCEFTPGCFWTCTIEWNETAQALLDRAPDRLAVLKQYVARFRPRSWNGSLAAAMEAPLGPLLTLEGHADPALAEFAKAGNSTSDQFFDHTGRVRDEFRLPAPP